MSDFLRAEFASPAPPPPSPRGGWVMVRENLFGDAKSTAITLAVAALLFFAGPPLWRFLVADAVFRAPNGELCRAPGAGACWAYIAAKTPFFIYGSYPPEFYWRVNVTFFLAASLIVWLLWPNCAEKASRLSGFSRCCRRWALSCCMARRRWGWPWWTPAGGEASWCRCSPP